MCGGSRWQGLNARNMIYKFKILILLAATSQCHKRPGSRVKCMLKKFLHDEDGATAIEYGLIAALIALAIIAAVGMTGERLITLFESLIPALTR